MDDKLKNYELSPEERARLQAEEVAAAKADGNWMQLRKMIIEELREYCAINELVIRAVEMDPQSNEMRVFVTRRQE